VHPVKPSVRPNVQADVRVRPNQDMPRDFDRTRTITPNVQADVNVRNKNWDNNKNRHDNNWRTRSSNSISWEQARRHRHHDHHDRNWWRSRYSRFALFGSGFYFWDGGYWFPAYGYDPGYNTYSYDEPIYGYNDLDPARVIANVQTELQRLGYYRYAVDGTMGPATRAAIANYQRDTGLSITSAIDGPTLQSLGLG
jgi:Putative peptidoglycan binding domain